MKQSFLQYFNTWKTHKTLQLSSLLVLIANFVVVAGVFSLSENLKQILTLWGEKATVGVYLNDSLDLEKIENLSKKIKEFEEVGSIKYVSPENAYHDFQDQMKQYAPQLLKESDMTSFLPSSFEVSLASHIKLENQYDVLLQISKKLMSLEGVEEVTYGQNWVNQFNNVIVAFSNIGKVFLIILFSAVFFIISSSLKSSIYQRSEVIELMELLGASPLMVRKPFILEGIFHGLIASLCALLIYFGLFQFFMTYIKSNLAFLQIAHNLKFLSLISISTIIISGPLLGGLSAYLSLRKLNSGWLSCEVH